MAREQPLLPAIVAAAMAAAALRRPAPVPALSPARRTAMAALSKDHEDRSPFAASIRLSTAASPRHTRAWSTSPTSSPRRASAPLPGLQMGGVLQNPSPGDCTRSTKPGLVPGRGSAQTAQGDQPPHHREPVSEGEGEERGGLLGGPHPDRRTFAGLLPRLDPLRGPLQCVRMRVCRTTGRPLVGRSERPPNTGRPARSISGWQSTTTARRAVLAERSVYWTPSLTAMAQEAPEWICSRSRQRRASQRDGQDVESGAGQPCRLEEVRREIPCACERRNLASSASSPQRVTRH